jgi:hypothetical protein
MGMVLTRPSVRKCHVSTARTTWNTWPRTRRQKSSVLLESV